MNELYQSEYASGIYDPIYLPAIIFYDEESELAMAAVAAVEVALA